MIKKGLTAVLAAVGATIFGTGATFLTKKAVAVSVIGGADGPTSVFVAGKIGDRFWWTMMIAGAVMIGLSVTLFVFLTKKKQ